MESTPIVTMDIGSGFQVRPMKLQNVEEIPSLPEEIIIAEILPRLPVKSLLKFRCVAKAWRFLISTKKFRKAHLKGTTSFAHHIILFNTFFDFRQCSLISLCNSHFTDTNLHNIDFGINPRKNRIRIVGCCNGLVCLLIDRNRFVLWNPATRMFNNLPDFAPKSTCRYISRSGFGLDELTDDYKVSGLLAVYKGNGQYRYTSKMYSLSTNSWEMEVVERIHPAPFGKEGKFFSGKLHWGGYADGIYTLDLNTKVYGIIEIPDVAMRSRVGVLKGCLSLCIYHCNNCIDIWVMKEYGVKGSWYKLAIVPSYRTPYLQYVIPETLGIFPNGEILLCYWNILVIYNPGTMVFRRPRINNSAMFVDFGMYTESLVSVFPCAGEEN